MLTATPLKIASLGDSLTDEYALYPPDRTAAQNWVQTLVSLRGGQNGNPDQVDFGAFSSTSRGETRNQGYAQDWARSGATSGVYHYETNFLKDPNLTSPYNLKQELDGVAPKKGMYGLLNQPGGVSNLNVVTLLIGGNDFADTAINGILHDETPRQVFGDLFGGGKPGQPTFLTTNVMKPIKAAVNAIEAAAVKDNNPNLDIVLVTTPDVTLTPLVSNLLAGLPPSAGGAFKFFLKAAATAIDTAEMNYVTKLSNPHIASVDINALFNNFIQNEHATIDGMQVDPNGAGPVASDLFVGDSFHPGTIAQGILAQKIAAQIDVWNPNAITPISDADIVSQALAVQPVTVATLTAPGGATQGSPVALTLTVNPFTVKYPPVTPDQYPFPNPTGTVTFLDSYNGNNIVLGTAPVISSASLGSDGVATFTTSTLPVGDNLITAVYNGDTVYPPTSPTQVQVTVTGMTFTPL